MRKTTKFHIATMLSLGLAVGGIIGSGFASAEVTSGPFDFIIDTSHESTSSNVQKTKDATAASVDVEYYKNDSNENYLLLQVKRSGTAVTAEKRITKVGNGYSMSYYKSNNVTAGQSLQLNGKLSHDATKGNGRMHGNWTP